MRCAECGSESEYTVCGMCMIKRIEPLKVPAVVELTVCSICGAKRLDRWKDVSLEEAIDYEIEKNIFLHEEVEPISYDFYSYGSDESGKYVFEFEGKIRDYTFSQQLFFEVRFHRISCDKCSRQAGGYYEAIIQIRAENRDLMRDELERIGEIIGNNVEKQRENQRAFVTKIEERKEGVDIYIGDKRLAKKIANAIIREFGGTLTESSKIAGRRDGRDIYRFTYSVRLPEYFKGDLVDDEGNFAIVTDVSRRKGINVQTGKSVNLKNPKVIARKSEVIESFVLSTDESAIEILDPGTYESIYVEKPDFEFEAGDKVFIAKFGDRIIAIHRSLVEP